MSVIACVVYMYVSVVTNAIIASVVSFFIVAIVDGRSMCEGSDFVCDTIDGNVDMIRSAGAD